MKRVICRVISSFDIEYHLLSILFGLEKDYTMGKLKINIENQKNKISTQNANK